MGTETTTAASPRLASLAGRPLGSVSPDDGVSLH
jgi:hypothetical protein